jgi:hypothetical protein
MVARTDRRHLPKLFLAMLWAGEKLDGTFAVIPVVHGHLMFETNTFRRLRAAYERTQSGSRAFPIMSGEIAKVAMAHVASSVAVIFNVPSRLTLSVFFPILRLPEGGINDCCAVLMTLPCVSNRMHSTALHFQQ